MKSLPHQKISIQHTVRRGNGFSGLDVTTSLQSPNGICLVKRTFRLKRENTQVILLKENVFTLDLNFLQDEFDFVLVKMKSDPIYPLVIRSL